VVEGTTVTIAIPGQFEVGYGRAWVGSPDSSLTTLPPDFDASNPKEDLQRGEMKFTLVDKSAPFNPVARLPVRLITRVALDAASGRATNVGSKEHTQVIALLDIPVGLVVDAPIGPQPNSKDFGIMVERFRRDPASGLFMPVLQSTPTGSPEWYGWGGPSGTTGAQLIPITIDDAPGADASETARFTPITGWDAYNSRVWASPYSSTNLESTVPRPEFRIQLPDSVVQPPYAWEIEVRYPASRMGILGVRLLRADPSGGIVTWKATPEYPLDGKCTATQDDGTLKIQVVDPDAAGDSPSSSWSHRSRGVAVIFALAKTSNEQCRAPIAPENVNVASVKAYSRDGVFLVPAPSFTVVAQDLH
jgi:hypothetical protein